MPAPTRFRSIFTGAEIDALLSSIKDKVSTSLIKNDFTGGEDYVASAEVAKILNDAIEQIKNPNYLKAQIQAIPDNNIYTTAEKNKLSQLSINDPAKPVVFATKAAVVNPTVPSFVFVTADETNSGARTLYFFDGATLKRVTLV